MLASREMETGKSILRDHINATTGFQKLGGLTSKSPKSLICMFSPTGNPQARNLFVIIHQLKECEGLRPKVKAAR